MTGQPTEQWWRETALVLVSRNLIEGWGQRGAWRVSVLLRITGHPEMLSGDLQRVLDQLADEGLIETVQGAGGVHLTTAGYGELCAALPRALVG